MSEHPEGDKTGSATPRQVLVALLAECQAAATLCFDRAREFDDPDQINAAARLIRAGVELTQALEGKPQTTHRLVIEREASA